MKHLVPAPAEIPFTVLISGTLFFALFILIIAVVYSSRRRKDYEETSLLPLQDENRLGSQIE